MPGTYIYRIYVYTRYVIIFNLSDQNAAVTINPHYYSSLHAYGIHMITY